MEPTWAVGDPSAHGVDWCLSQVPLFKEKEKNSWGYIDLLGVEFPGIARGSRTEEITKGFR